MYFLHILMLPLSWWNKVIYKLWPTPLPTNTVIPNPLYTSPQHLCTYICTLFVSFAVFLIYYFSCISFAIRLSGRKVTIKLIDWLTDWYDYSVASISRKLWGQGQSVFQAPREISFTFHFWHKSFILHDAKLARVIIQQQFWMKECYTFTGSKHILHQGAPSFSTLIFHDVHHLTS